MGMDNWKHANIPVECRGPGQDSSAAADSVFTEG
jgi:hypothetical protein